MTGENIMRSTNSDSLSQVPSYGGPVGEDLQRISAGRYRVLGPLGKGGMGAVWRALDVELGRPVAVKELRLPEHISEQDRRNLYARMEREARAAARLKHPGIVTVYNRLVGDDGRPWIVMELIEGGRKHRRQFPITPCSNTGSPAALAPDGQTVAMMSFQERQLCFYSTKTYTQIGLTRKVPEEAKMGPVAFSRDGAILASGGKTVRLWNTRTFEQIGPDMTPVETEVVSRDGD
ncbi:hypothetical protein [Nonomuraea sp. NPDC049400]|uniref:protein kinase domain-containing protein n=1 Tax=Nonomuraea sp. NPDC049400 TaxID=3364352 RepID=UPI0037887282